MDLANSLFYYFGMSLWFLLCLSALIAVILLGIVAPIHAYGNIRIKWWQWFTLGKFAKLEITKEELYEAAFKAKLNEEWIEKAQKFLSAINKEGTHTIVKSKCDLILNHAEFKVKYGYDICPDCGEKL